MRLYKKAAAVLLAAAMAVSMMTACGGGAGGGNGGNGGNGGDTEIVEPVPGPDTTDPGQGGETGGTTTQPEKTKIPDVTKSQYAKFSQNLSKSNEFYVQAAMAEYEGKTKTGEGTMIMARKGDDVYVKTVATQKGKTQEYAVFAEKTNDGKYARYLLFEDAKTALKSIQDDPLMDFSKEEELPKEMYRTTVKVGGKEYYAETYTDEGGSEQTTCFDENGKPKYQFSQRKDGTSETMAYQTIRFGNSNNLCQVNGYKVYTMENDTEGKPILIDESGNEYKVTFEVDQTTHKYVGMKVKDSSGKDVTKDFAWFDSYIKTTIS